MSTGFLCGGDGGELAPFGANGYDVAALAAGGAISAVEAVMRARSTTPTPSRALPVAA